MRITRERERERRKDRQRKKRAVAVTYGAVIYGEGLYDSRVRTRYPKLS